MKGSQIPLNVFTYSLNMLKKKTRSCEKYIDMNTQNVDNRKIQKIVHRMDIKKNKHDMEKIVTNLKPSPHRIKARWVRH